MDSSAGAQALIERAGVRRLAGEAVTAARGDDARTWLQGQITADLRGLEPAGGVYALVLSLQGKILTDLWVFDRGDEGLALLWPQDVAESLRAYLDRFVVMEDVELEATDEAVLTVQGPVAEEVVAAAALDAPAYRCDRLGTGGCDLLVEPGRAAASFDALVSAARAIGGGPVDEAGWELARVRLGRPRYGADFGDWTLPQEAGLKGAVAFDKGCYQGQEPVVMLEHRGKPPKRLVLLELDGPELEGDLPTAGTEILRDDGSRAGRITSVVRDPSNAGSAPALGLLRRAFAAEGTELRVSGMRARVRRVVGE